MTDPVPQVALYVSLHEQIEHLAKRYGQAPLDIIGQLRRHYVDQSLATRDLLDDPQTQEEAVRYALTIAAAHEPTFADEPFKTRQARAVETWKRLNDVPGTKPLDSADAG